MDKTLMKGLRVLECVARSQTPRGASDVAAELGMTKSNAYRTLQTLMAMKYITRHGDQPTYEPSAKLFELGTLVGNRFEVKAMALPILQELVRRTGENAAVAVLDDREVVYVERVDSPNPVRSVVRTGERLPSYCSASGKALLAYASDELIDSMEDILLPFTEHTITTVPALREELARIREKGVAIVNGEWHLQVAGIAVPIRNPAGKVVAALSVSGPAERFKAPQMRFCTEAALWGAEEFRKRLS
jgi:IclR family KDG regulon transcriptional repressor